MKNKVIIFHNTAHHSAKAIIDKEELEEYIIKKLGSEHHGFKHDMSSGFMGHYHRHMQYLSHKITYACDSAGRPDNWGGIKVNYTQYMNGPVGRKKIEDYTHEYSFLEIDTIPTWEAQPKALNNNIKTNSMTPTKIPRSISINEIEFSQLQIENIPQIKSIQQYIEIPSENINMKPEMIPGRIEFLPIELHLFATMDQIEKIRSVFSASTNSQNPSTKRKPDILKMVYANTTTYIEGFLRDLSYPVELEYPEYVNVQMSFVVNTMFTK